jgi:hypothetical protein
MAGDATTPSASWIRQIRRPLLARMACTEPPRAPKTAMPSATAGVETSHEPLGTGYDQEPAPKPDPERSLLACW